MGMEPWDSSDLKANELALSMFGTQEEASEKARMPKLARDFAEASEILGGLVGKPLTLIWKKQGAGNLAPGVTP